MAKRPARITEPLIVPASLDPDAVKIIRRLLRYGHEAYLVGGCVRDLSLGRIPKDFDIATSARPRQIKRLFRNSRIIGRRFKLVHVQFGEKIIEVSTFRRNPGDSRDDGLDEPLDEASGEPLDLSLDDDLDDVPPPRPRRSRGRLDDDFEDEDDGDAGDDDSDLLIRRDNVFGSAEEDAVRRDFTINGLFYDVESNEVIDFVGGARDLDRRVVRTIGDPRIRFQEDPLRILRAIRFASRLGFKFEAKTYKAMVEFHRDIEKCAAPRVTEELLRLFSCGASQRAWDLLDRTGALGIILPEIAEFIDDDPQIEGWSASAPELLTRYFEVVDLHDRGRRIVSNATLLTVLLIGPIRRLLREGDDVRDAGVAADRVLRPFAARMSISRRDAFRVKQIIVSQARLRSSSAGSRRRRRVKPVELVQRDYFKDALDFCRIETEALDLDRGPLDRWTELYYDVLRRDDPAEYRRARREALFDEVEAEPDGPEKVVPRGPLTPGDEFEDPGMGDAGGAFDDADADDAADADAGRFGDEAVEAAADGDEESPHRRSRRRRRRGRRGGEARAPGHDAGREATTDEPPDEGSHEDRDAELDWEESDPGPDGGDDDVSERDDAVPSEDDESAAPHRRRRRRRRRRGSHLDRDDAPAESDVTADGDWADADAEPRPEHGNRDERPATDDEPRGGRSRRRKRRSSARDDEPSRHRDEGASARRGSGPGPKGGDEGRRRSRGPEGRERGARDDRRPDRPVRRDRDGKDGRRDRHDERKRREPPAKSGGSSGQRLEFDEVRAGPLKVNEQGPARDEDDDAEVMMDLDAPLPTVGDPGPISVIRTGIDQTEKKGRKKRRKKKDAAFRELEKEVEHQPSLQALKMSEGDPRGHEATRPRKVRREEKEKAAPPKDRPFDPVLDFEWIENVFNW